MRRPSRSRPPKLDAAPAFAAVSDPVVAHPPRPAEQLVRAGVAGRARGLGATELRHLAERVADGEPGVLAGLEAFPGLALDEVEAGLEQVFGTVPGAPPGIDPDRALEAMAVAAGQIVGVAATGGRIALATACPASLLPLHQHLARLASAAGAGVGDEPDSPPFRTGGRTGRFLRWFGGVAAVTDGASLLAAEPEAADELLFTIRRPHLLVTDGPFAGRSVAAGIPTVAFAGLGHAALAVAARRGEALTVVPVATDRSPAAYAPLVAVASGAQM